MRVVPIVLTTVAAALLASAALSASAAPDPARIVLQKADFPAGTTLSRPTKGEAAQAVSAYAVTGLRGAITLAAVAAGGSIKTSGGNAPKRWRVQAQVLVSPDAAGAKKVFALDSSGGGPLKVKLPTSYGDQQDVFVMTGSFASQASIAVRKLNTVWKLRIVSDPPQWSATKAQLLAQLKIYAGKQARRIGSGR